MKIEEIGGEIHILELPVESMGLLSLGVALWDEEQQVLQALLQGKKVRMHHSAMEYKKYKKTAPMGVFRKFVALERSLREMGICVIRDSDR